MQRLRTRTALVIALVGFSLGLLITSALAQSSSPSTNVSTTATTNTVTTGVSKRSETCTAVRKRLADAPQILTRIETNIDRLRSQLDTVRLAVRRASLESRIVRLEVLRSELIQKITSARRACATV